MVVDYLFRFKTTPFIFGQTTLLLFFFGYDVVQRFHLPHGFGTCHELHCLPQALRKQPYSMLDSAFLGLCYTFILRRVRVLLHAARQRKIISKMMHSLYLTRAS
mmetsp:Transcript_9109/g.17741  ORF Transcript_9109/g.17741 Transcript_9109/m.17741 type:complete len:104 (+) Transcript_9109:1758-2069(+)